MPTNSLLHATGAFAALLRDHGFFVSLPDIMSALHAVGGVGVANRQDFCAALRSAFVKRSEEIPLFDYLFNQFWSLETLGVNKDAGHEEDEEKSAADDGVRGTTFALWAGEVGVSESQEVQAWNERPYCLYSPLETLKRQDLASIPVENDAQLARLIRSIIRPLARYPRWQKRDAASGLSIDFRKMLRKNLQHGGEVYELPRQKPKLKVKKIAFLCDVSGSMNPYLRSMLSFIKEFQRINLRVETYVFATRLHRITDLLKNAPFARALERIAATAQDWGGGTRIGECLGHFNALREAGSAENSTLVVIYSDGWDRGDARELNTQMSRLRRRCYKLLWINPLLGGRGYEPTCRGMRTALPYIDFFLPGHNIRSLDRLAKTIHALL
ncbi:MAG: vWA domain-containing protein [Desulfomonilaceae bacterium]